MWTPDDLLAQAERMLRLEKFSAAEEFLFLVQKSDPLNAKAFALAGELFIKTNNFPNAERMYSQAGVLEPENEEYQTKLDDVQVAIQEINSMPPESPEPQESLENEKEQLPFHYADIAPIGPKFDFVIVPGSPMMGSTGFRAYLSLHPEVQVPPKEVSDEAFATERESELLAWLHHKMHYSSNTKFGMVQHAFVDGITADEKLKVAERTAAITDAESFIQIVRHPYDAIRGLYDQHVWSELRYEFSEYNIPQIEGYDPSAIAEFPRPNFSNKSFKQFKEPVLVDRIPEFCGRIRYFESGTRYAAHFPNWEVMDLSEIFPNNIEKGMKRLFKLIGVSEDFFHPRFRMPGANVAQRFLRSNMRIELSGHPLRFRIAYRGADMYDISPELNPVMPVVSMQPTAEWIKSGQENWPLDLLVFKEDWFELPETLRADFLKLHAQNVLSGYATYWVNAFETVNNLAHPLMFDQLPKEQKCRAWDLMKQDLAEFLKIHSNFSELWGDVEKCFTGSE